MTKIILQCVLLLVSCSAWAEVEVIPLRHRSADEVLPAIRPLLDKNGAASGMDDRLILRSSRRNIAEIKRVLKSIDIERRHLLISVMQGVDGDTVKRLTGLSGADSGEGQVISTRSLEDDKRTLQVQVLEGERALVGSERPPSGAPQSNAAGGFYVRAHLNGEQVTLEISSTQDAGPGRGNPVAVHRQLLDTTVSGWLGAWILLGGASPRAATDDSVVSTRDVSGVHDQNNVLLKVEELP